MTVMAITIFFRKERRTSSRGNESRWHIFTFIFSPRSTYAESAKKTTEKATKEVVTAATNSTVETSKLIYSQTYNER